MVILPRQGRWRTMGQSYGRVTILVALLLCLTHAQEYNYAQLIDASFFFYEAQASGVLPSWNRASRANGGWRDASFVDDGKDIGKNLSGGWFDAGDYVKFQLPYGWSVSVLAWSVLEFPAAFSGANAQLYGVAKRNLQWAADFIVKSHVTASDNPADNVYVAQVGDTDADHGKWGRAEQWYASGSTYRPTWLVDRNRPGSDIVGNAVASLAGVAMVLRMEDPASSQANALLARARQLYAFAKAYPGAWGIPSGNYPYGTGSRQWQDEMLWAAVWMCRAGQGASYCTDAVNGWSTASGMGFATAAGMDWDNVFNAASVMMLGMPDKFPAAKLADVRRRMDANLNKWHVSTKCTQPPPGTDWNGDGVVDDWTICYSGKGLAHLAQWGTLRSTANAAALKLVYSKYIADAPAEVARQRCWARGQLRLMLGDWGRSFVVGMGTNPPQRPHHRSSSCDLDYAVPCDYGVLRLTRANPAVLRGALVGGPNKRDEYLDDRADYVLNEVALDYNAGYTVALAGLLALGATTPNWNAYCGTPASPSASPKPSPSPSPSPKPSPSPSPSPKPSPSPSPSPKPSPSPSPSPKPSPSPSLKPSPSPSPKPSPSPSSSPKPSPTPSPSPKPSPSPSPSPKPSPTPSPSPSPSASPSPTNGICPAARWECTGCESTTQPGTPLAAQRTPCYNCVNARGAPNSWQCHACVSNTSYTAVQASSCLACVIGGGDSWACKAYCTDLSTDANLLPSCTGCTADAGIRTTAQQWRCGLCMAPAVLANGLDAAKGCFSCVRSGREPNVCVECSKKLNVAARSTCLSCVAANPGSPWGCV